MGFGRGLMGLDRGYWVRVGVIGIGSGVIGFGLGLLGLVRGLLGLGRRLLGLGRGYLQGVVVMNSKL